MPRAVNKCPQCGSPVTQFAAGCAICGFDLEAVRARRGPTVSDRLAVAKPGWLRSATLREELVLAVILAVLVLFSPFFGLLLAAWIAYDRNRRGDQVSRNIALGFAALSVVLLAVPDLRWGIFILLG